jgi:hypothetical protein
LFDQPDLKAIFELAVIAPSDWIVISHELPTKIEKFLPESL